MPTSLTPDDLRRLDALAIADLVRRGELDRAEVTRTFASRIEAANPDLAAFVDIDPEAALGGTEGQREGPLDGVPFAVKDIASYPGMRWAMGSRLFAANRGHEHTPHSRAVDEAGLVTLGKTATSELALLGSTETLLEGVTANPWKEGVSAAGSSGGAAAAVAAGLLPLAHASDGGGSIRVPASACGVFGFMPSNGRCQPAMPAAGGLGRLVVEHAVSRSVRDSAMLLALTERTDETAPYDPIGFVDAALDRSLRVATWRVTLGGHQPAREVAEALDSAIALLVALGHRVEETTPPAIDGRAASDAFFTLAGQSVDQVATMMAPMLGREVGSDELEPFTLELLDRYRGLPADASDWADRVLGEAGSAYRSVFDDADVVVTPTMAIPPWPVGYLAPTLPYETLVARTERAVGYTPIHNIAGCPAMSVPLSWSPDGLPIGVHVAARPGDDALLLRLAYQLETARPWRDRRPANGSGDR
ncbi:amidase [Egibacter rhizosphaerae]|uniref:Amidase n=2 Tax=Egibacter rhizosphaerae TaxID=1670831 RepID=A0A411YL74_9ACTN|nr:amidase [Egibacter rhizosphaerae]